MIATGLPGCDESTSATSKNMGNNMTTTFLFYAKLANKQTINLRTHKSKDMARRYFYIRILTHRRTAQTWVI